MVRQALKEEILFKLTGGLLECELDDKAMDMIINSSMRELQRYMDSTKIITIPYEKCIDVSKYKMNSVSRIYRSSGFTTDTDGAGGLVMDPMQVSQWQLISGTGNLMNFANYAYDYASWNTLLQIRNTVSTDLAFRYDKSAEKLYINLSSSSPEKITIEYIPRYEDVSEITSDYWIDILTRMCVANAKIAVGNIRTRYTQSSGALWSQDGSEKLQEGKEELSALREALEKATQLVYPID